MADILHPDPADSEADDQSPAGVAAEAAGQGAPGQLDREHFTVAATALDRFEADLLLQACDDLGIPAMLQEPRAGMVGKLSAPADAFVVAVPASEVERARALLAQRRGALEADAEGGERAAEDEEAQTEGAGAAGA